MANPVDAEWKNLGETLESYEGIETPYFGFHVGTQPALLLDLNRFSVPMAAFLLFLLSPFQDGG